jgi:hypothetical protein
MVDTRIRKNEHCVIGLPACDYVFSSTRSCFIAYGFSTSRMECDILQDILKDRGIEAMEAGSQIEPGKFAFCTKICSKIMVAQFCVVIVNSDKRQNGETPNANVNMEYGLMLGHNKYVIPFQRDDQILPFNVAGLDTIKYNQGNFRALAIRAIDQAIRETSQVQPAPSFDQMLSLFLIAQNAIIVNLQDDPGERFIFQLGSAFEFNLLVKFDGLSYVFLGNFGVLQGDVVIWRLQKLLEMINARMQAAPIRIQLGLATVDNKAVLDFFFQKMEIWLVVNGEKEEDQIKSWISNTPLPLTIFTLSRVAEIAVELPKS